MGTSASGGDGSPGGPAMLTGAAGGTAEDSHADLEERRAIGKVILVP